MSKAKKPIVIPVPEGADMRSEAAAVAAHPAFKRMVARGRNERAASRQGQSHEEVWAELEPYQVAEEDTHEAESEVGSLRQLGWAGSTTSLRPMTEAEFPQIRAELMEDYAAQRARNLGTALEEERRAAEQQFAELLPEGLRTDRHHFWIVVDDAGARLGVLWAFVDVDQGRAFIYDIAIDEPHRGKGNGRRTLELLEDFVKPLGVTRISLNVFADNDVAIGLYQKQGYRTTNLNMTKHLSSPT